jgi:ribosomal protein L11 methyltransferase
MNYTKVAITLIPYSSDASDVMIALMGEMDYESFQESETGFDAYIPSQLFDLEKLKAIETPFEQLKFTYTLEEIPDQNWNEVWEKNYFQPIIIGDQCVVRGPFHETFPHIPYQILIEPKMAFGTGHHETTGLMLQFILDTQMENQRVIDMGCGTGILGILAAMRGASEVVGIDIDEWSYKSSLENCELNNVNMELYQGDAGLLPNFSPFDIMLANINRNILLADLDTYSSVVKPNGTLIMSGFYKEDLPVITQKAQQTGFHILTFKENNNWVAAAYTKTE